MHRAAIFVVTRLSGGINSAAVQDKAVKSDPIGITRPGTTGRNIWQTEGATCWKEEIPVDATAAMRYWVVCGNVLLKLKYITVAD